MELLTRAPTLYGIMLAIPFTGLFTSVYERLLRAFISSAFAWASDASAAASVFLAICRSYSETTLAL